MVYLSDSPPDKDIQWSATGVDAANKFLQKIWNLNFTISSRTDTKKNKSEEEKLVAEINGFVLKIDESINKFRFNVAIAYFYQVYKLLKNCIVGQISNKVLEDCIIKIMKLMVPFTPLSSECLELFNCKTSNKWPEIDKKIFG